MTVVFGVGRHPAFGQAVHVLLFFI